MTKPISPRID